MIRLPSPRDVLILQDGDTAFVSAVDSCGGIGPLEYDALAAPPELVGVLTARTALLEVVCTGAQPAFAAVSVSNGGDTADRLLTGARRSFSDALPLVVSTEKNIPTSMTALGVTLTGVCAVSSLRIGGAQKGDLLCCAGLPYVGAQVLQHADRLPTPGQIQTLLRSPHVRAALPVGSRGIATEAYTLAAESGLSARLCAPAHIDVAQSAGPSSCVLLAIAAGTSLSRAALPMCIIGELC